MQSPVGIWCPGAGRSRRIGLCFGLFALISVAVQHESYISVEDAVVTGVVHAMIVEYRS